MADLGQKRKTSVMRDCTVAIKGFPNLVASGFDVVRDCTSDRTPDYNCIAWAAGKVDEWWWPWDISGYTWPKGNGLRFELPNQETLENFVLAFKGLSYKDSDNALIEDGFEKVAIFTDPNGRPKHAARSLPNGVWTSKLGQAEDIQHPTLHSIEGITYGKATYFLKRRIQNA